MICVLYLGNFKCLLLPTFCLLTYARHVTDSFGPGLSSSASSELIVTNTKPLNFILLQFHLTFSWWPRDEQPLSLRHLPPFTILIPGQVHAHLRHTRSRVRLSRCQFLLSSLPSQQKFFPFHTHSSRPWRAITLIPHSHTSLPFHTGMLTILLKILHLSIEGSSWSFYYCLMTNK